MKWLKLQVKGTLLDNKEQLKVAIDFFDKWYALKIKFATDEKSKEKVLKDSLKLTITNFLASLEKIDNEGTTIQPVVHGYDIEQLEKYIKNNSKYFKPSLNL